MHLIVVISECTLPDAEVRPSIEEFVADSQRRHETDGVTGVLLYENRNCVHVIEGEESAVRESYARIAEDPNHRNVRKLVDEPVRARAFPGWAMHTFFVDSPELVDTETLELMHRLYDHHFRMNARDFIDFLKTMIDQLDRFRILHSDR